MSKRYLWFLSLAALILSSLCLTSCRHNKKYRIAVSQCSDDDWRKKMNNEINREILFHEDAEVEIRSADDSNSKQIEDIEYFINNKFDAIIVAPNEAEALTPVISKAYENGIPVIIFDRNINGESYTARIGADDVALGMQAAKYALNTLPNAPKALEICGLPGSTPALGRHNGFTDEFIRNGGQIRASVPANWNQDMAEKVTDSLLNIYKDIDVIFAHNDRMAIGAYEMAGKHNLHNVKIIGIDAAPEIGIQAVADGKIDATFLYPTEGHRVIQTALDILKGKPYQRVSILPASSPVDKSNADILLLQNESLIEETNHMVELKNSIDQYWAQHSSQTLLFYAAVVIIVLLGGVFFLLLRAFWQHRRYQVELMEQNRLLQEQRDKQKELNEKLQEATQSKIAFFTNVSHDLRTPLTLISGPVEQLVTATNLSPMQSTLMRIADKNVKILKRLINQILDFRKYENGQLKMHLEEADFGMLIKEWMEAFHSLARKRNLKFRLIAPQHPAVSLAFDVEKIERVVFNLLSNAFKYTPDNGEVTVAYNYDDKDLTLTVTDTGEGISERDLGSIFDRFYQVDRVHPNGSGIGLSLAKAFVELHEGTISVESALGKGSVFTVTIPIQHVESTAATHVSPLIDSREVESELGDVTDDTQFEKDLPVVLIVDDNPDIQILVGNLLEKKYNIITAANGKEGVKMATKYVPDLVICDVMMPVMDGLECCRRIKDEVTTSHIPVLMLTACSMDEQRVQGYDSGADGYLSKPFSSEVLLARCNSLLENRKRISRLYDSTAIKSAPDADRQEKSRALPKGDIDNDFYRRFLEIFEKEMGNPEMNVDAISSRMGLERSQFYRKIKALTNYSPVELMRNIRLRRGHELLLKTDKSISEIAYETGFSTPAYFTKCYRDAYGETPSEVRAKNGR